VTTKKVVSKRFDEEDLDDIDEETKQEAE